MAQPKITIRPEVALKMARTEMRKRVAKAAEYLVSKIKQNLSIPTRTAGPSQPGEFPHADTGRLRNDIYWRFVDDVIAQAGSNLDYALRLEYEMDRSFLRRTLWEEWPTLRRILEGGQ